MDAMYANNGRVVGLNSEGAWEYWAGAWFRLAGPREHHYELFAYLVELADHPPPTTPSRKVA